MRRSTEKQKIYRLYQKAKDRSLMDNECWDGVPLIEGTLRTTRKGKVEQVENGKWVKLELEK